MHSSPDQHIRYDLCLFFIFDGGIFNLPEQLYETSCSEELQEAHIHHLIHNNIFNITKKIERSPLKGLCHEMNNFLKAFYDKNVLSVHALIVFQIFVSYLNEKTKLKVLACSFKITY